MHLTKKSDKKYILLLKIIQVIKISHNFLLRSRDF